MGLAQLEDTGYDSSDVAIIRPRQLFSPSIGVSVGRSSSSSSSSSPSNRVKQKRLLLRRKQHQPSSVMDSTDGRFIAEWFSLPFGWRCPKCLSRFRRDCFLRFYVLTSVPTPAYSAGRRESVVPMEVNACGTSIGFNSLKGEYDFSGLSKNLQ